MSREIWVNGSNGVVLWCDGQIDGKGRPPINLLVNSASGTVFLNSIDTNDIIKDVKQMFELLDSLVEVLWKQGKC